MIRVTIKIVFWEEVPLESHIIKTKGLVGEDTQPHNLSMDLINQYEFGEHETSIDIQF
jgi:hypothetical protein